MEGYRNLRRRDSPHFVDNRLTYGGEVVSLTHRTLFIPQEDS
jgi:hypothetical protein